MQCPYCGGESKVSDSRDHPDGVRRRRQCLSCKRKFTTYERKETLRLQVIKRDNRTEPFSVDKIASALGRVCRGLAIESAQLSRLAALVEAHFVDAGVDARGKTIRSGDIAAQVLERLREVDRVAYDRMAINYVGPDGLLRTDAPAPGGGAKQLGLLLDVDPDE